jgi:hypothetical protein
MNHQIFVTGASFAAILPILPNRLNNPNANSKGIAMKRNYATAILCVLTLAGCAANHRYQLSKDDAGRLVRLDTRTGEVMLIQGDQITPVKGSAATADQTGPQDEQIPQVVLPDGGKKWPTLTLPELDNTNAELTSYWYNGKLHYVLELHPLSKRLKLIYSGYYSNPSLSLIVKNAAGKRVVWTNLPTSRLKHTINKTRKVEQLSVEGVIRVSKDEYDSLANWELRWNP